jgi:hypothetical protein
MPAKPRPVAEMLAELEEALSVVRVRETRLVANGEHVHGLCDYGSHTIHIDPRPAIFDTLFHEALHHRYPSWSERRVSNEAGRLVSGMTAADVRHWWRLYRKAVKPSRRPLNVDED